MKRIKTQKGITLVALIITIVVLLILAVVAITAIQNTGILEHANNAATQYNQKQEQENTFLNEYANFLNNYASTGTGTQTYTAYDAGDTVRIGTEEFYVLEASSETEAKVLLLAKQCIDTTNLVQSSSANTIEFSSTAFWGSDAHDIVITGEPDSTYYAGYAAYKYGEKLEGAGRLLYQSEDILEGTDIEMAYWYGTADTGTSHDVWCSDGPVPMFSEYGVRPVVEISKTLID